MAMTQEQMQASRQRLQDQLERDRQRQVELQRKLEIAGQKVQDIKRRIAAKEITTSGSGLGGAQQAVEKLQKKLGPVERRILVYEGTLKEGGGVSQAKRILAGVEVARAKAISRAELRKLPPAQREAKERQIVVARAKREIGKQYAKYKLEPQFDQQGNIVGFSDIQRKLSFRFEDLPKERPDIVADLEKRGLIRVEKEVVPEYKPATGTVEPVEKAKFVWHDPFPYLREKIGERKASIYRKEGFLAGAEKTALGVLGVGILPIAETIRHPFQTGVGIGTLAVSPEARRTVREQIQTSFRYEPEFAIGGLVGTAFAPKAISKIPAGFRRLSPSFAGKFETINIPKVGEVRILKNTQYGDLIWREGKWSASEKVAISKQLKESGRTGRYVFTSATLKGIRTSLSPEGKRYFEVKAGDKPLRGQYYSPPTILPPKNIPQILPYYTGLTGAEGQIGLVEFAYRRLKGEKIRPAFGTGRAFVYITRDRIRLPKWISDTALRFEKGGVLTKTAKDNIKYWKNRFLSNTVVINRITGKPLTKSEKVKLILNILGEGRRPVSKSQLDFGIAAWQYSYETGTPLVGGIEVLTGAKPFGPESQLVYPVGTVFEITRPTRRQRIYKRFGIERGEKFFEIGDDVLEFVSIKKAKTKVDIPITTKELTAMDALSDSLTGRRRPPTVRVRRPKVEVARPTPRPREVGDFLFERRPAPKRPTTRVREVRPTIRRRPMENFLRTRPTPKRPDKPRPRDFIIPRIIELPRAPKRPIRPPFEIPRPTPRPPPPFIPKSPIQVPRPEPRPKKLRKKKKKDKPRKSPAKFIPAPTGWDIALGVKPDTRPVFARTGFEASRLFSVS